MENGPISVLVNGKTIPLKWNVVTSANTNGKYMIVEVCKVLSMGSKPMIWKVRVLF